MATVHRGSTKLQCRGCFATLSMTFTNAIYIETTFEMASNIVSQNNLVLSVLAIKKQYHLLETVRGTHFARCSQY